MSDDPIIAVDSLRRQVLESRYEDDLVAMGIIELLYEMTASYRSSNFALLTARTEMEHRTEHQTHMLLRLQAAEKELVAAQKEIADLKAANVALYDKAVRSKLVEEVSAAKQQAAISSADGWTWQAKDWSDAKFEISKGVEADWYKTLFHDLRIKSRKPR